MADAHDSGVIKRACIAVGENPPKNFRFGNLQDQIADLETRPDTAALCSALRDKVVTADAQLLQKYDDEAKAHQRSFKRYYRASFLVLVLTAIISAAVLWLPMTQETRAWIEPLGMLLVSVGLLGSLVVAWRIRHLRLYELWKESRANAEYLRRIHFENVLDAPVEPDAPAAVPLLLLKLEYFRRYQLELQLAYHTERGGQHEQRAKFADKALFVCLFLAVGWFGLLALASAGIWFEQGVMPDWLPNWAVSAMSYLETVEALRMDSIGLLVVLGVSTAYGLLMVMVRLDDNVRNAARYKLVRENFVFVQGTPLAKVRETAAKGGQAGTAAVHHFVQEVHGIMSNELADWVRLRDLELGREEHKKNDAALSAAPPVA